MNRQLPARREADYDLAAVVLGDGANVGLRGTVVDSNRVGMRCHARMGRRDRRNGHHACSGKNESEISVLHWVTPTASQIGRMTRSSGFLICAAEPARMADGAVLPGAYVSLA